MIDSAGSDRLAPRWWNHQRHVLLRLRESIERALAGRLAQVPTKTAVDLGCGDRPYESLFRARGWEYVGCDLDERAQVRIATGDTVPLAAGSAGTVVSFQVLEHVWDLDWYLGQARRLIAPDGCLLLSTHGNWLYHPHPTDFRRWTRDGLVGEIEARGFRVESVDALVGPLAWTTQFRLLGVHWAVARLPGVGHLLAGALACCMNLRMAVEDWLTPTAVREQNACVYVVLAVPADRPADEAP